MQEDAEAWGLSAVAAIDHSTEEDAAATKIQAVQRGRQARQQQPQRPEPEGSDAAEDGGDSAEPTGSGGVASPDTEEPVEEVAEVTDDTATERAGARDEEEERGSGGVASPDTEEPVEEVAEVTDDTATESAGARDEEEEPVSGPDREEGTEDTAAALLAEEQPNDGIGGQPGQVESMGGGLRGPPAEGAGGGAEESAVADGVAEEIGGADRAGTHGDEGAEHGTVDQQLSGAGNDGDGILPAAVDLADGQQDDRTGDELELSLEGASLADSGLPSEDAAAAAATAAAMSGAAIPLVPPLALPIGGADDQPAPPPELQPLPPIQVRCGGQPHVTAAASSLGRLRGQSRQTLDSAAPRERRRASPLCVCLSGRM
jgi:hypothetical protein